MTIWFFSDLVVIANNFVEKPQAFKALFIDVRFVVELRVVGDRSEHDANTVVSFVV